MKDKKCLFLCNAQYQQLDYGIFIVSAFDMIEWWITNICFLYVGLQDSVFKNEKFPIDFVNVYSVKTFLNSSTFYM